MPSSDARPSNAASVPRPVLEIGIVPCRTCGKPHDLLDLGEHRSTWADPEDGHTYVRMTAEEVVTTMWRALGATPATVS